MKNEKSYLCKSFRRQFDLKENGKRREIRLLGQKINEEARLQIKETQTHPRSLKKQKDLYLPSRSFQLTSGG